MRIFTKGETRNTIASNIDDVMLTALTSFNSQSYTSVKAIQNTDVWNAVSTIASDIASLPLDYFIDNTKQYDSNITYLLNVKPNNFYNGFMLKFIAVSNILLNGESFIEMVKDKHGNTTALYHVKNSEITYKQDKTTDYKLVYEIKNGDKFRRVQADNILHFKFFSLDGIKGLSPISALKYDLETQQHSKRFLANFFKNNTSAGGILTVKGTKLSPEAKENLKKEWQEANAGHDNAHKVLVLDDTMSYEDIEINTEALSLINSNKHNTEAIAKVFKVPRHKMGLETSNMNLEQENNSYIINTLNPYLESITSEITFKNSNHIKKGACYKFNLDAFKTIDIETKTKVIKEQLTMGIIDINEARSQFGYEQLDDEIFNTHLVNLNHIPLSALADYQLSKLKHAPNSGSERGDIDE